MAMQTARNYVADTTYNMERALDQMPLSATETVKQLPITMQEINRYVEQLLTPEEQAICDMATD